MLAEKAEYLSTGIHIGMKSCTKYMKQFVYKVREDGLAVFNLQEVDNRIKIVSDFLSRYNKILVVSHKGSADLAAKKFAEAVGGRSIIGRFSPGTLTNPSYRGFFEPEAVIVTDPLVDRQAIEEAKRKRIPIIALCDTVNAVSDIDFVVPVNNNGKKALALIFWLMAREILKKSGKIKTNGDFTFTLKDFGDDGEKPKAKAPAENQDEVVAVEDLVEAVANEREKKPGKGKAQKENKG